MHPHIVEFFSDVFKLTVDLIFGTVILKMVVAHWIYVMGAREAKHLRVRLQRLWVIIKHHYHAHPARSPWGCTIGGCHLLRHTR